MLKIGSLRSASSLGVAQISYSLLRDLWPATKAMSAGRPDGDRQTDAPSVSQCERVPFTAEVAGRRDQCQQLSGGHGLVWSMDRDLELVSLEHPVCVRPRRAATP